MKKALAVVFICLPAFGQAVYSGSGSYPGSATYGYAPGGAGTPSLVAYNGVDVIQWGTIPNVSASGSNGELNNYSTGYDTSFLSCLSNSGGKCLNFDGSQFTNSAYLSPITRVTDQASVIGNVKQGFGAGQGGAGGRPGLTNTDTTLISLNGSGGAYYLCRFLPSGAHQGHCADSTMVPWYYNGSFAYPPSGDTSVVLTEAQQTGGNCTSNCTAVNFGAMEFDKHSNNLLYVWGNNQDVSTQTTVVPYVINPSTGQYTVGNPIVDFQYGLPQTNASAWATSTNYSFGQYVLHTLTAAEMATGGVWTSGQAYLPGDIITSQSGSFCAYKVEVGGTSSGTSPAFKTSSCATDTLTDAGGVKWFGLGAPAQFVYQEINPACTAGSPCTSSSTAFQWIATPTASVCTTGSMVANAVPQTLTCGTSVFTAAMVGQTVSVTGIASAGGTRNTTIAAYTSGTQVRLAVAATTTTSGTSVVSLTGHPDLVSSTAGDANGLVWQNVGVAVPAASGIGWFDKGDISADQAYAFTVSGTGYNGPAKFAAAMSTNTYHMAKSYSSGEDYASGGAGQDTGFWIIVYDATLNIYHLLNTLTGIAVDWGCTGGTGYNCSGGTWASNTVGQFKAISDPFADGFRPCPATIHAGRMSPGGLFYQITTTVSAPYSVCNSGSGYTNDDNWGFTTASFDPFKSLQNYEAGLNHSAFGTNYIYNFNSSGWGFTSGVFIGKYALNNVQGNTSGNPVTGTGFPPAVSVYLAPLNPGGSSQNVPQTVPPGCYITVAGTIKNPDCNLSEVTDSHISMAGDPGTDTTPACGTTYNYATLSPIAFNAWQGMETCWPTATTVPAGYTPPPSGALPLLPTTSFSGPWQFTHTFNTGTDQYFGTQFAISEYSQDANWLLFGSDWACQSGSQTGSVPAVWSSGTYYQMLMVAAVATPPLTTTTSLCGVPWVASILSGAASNYVAGNMINPLEGTGGGGQVDDVFQALTSGQAGYASSLGSGQPKCGTTSCFAHTNPPTSCTGTGCTANTINIASINGTGGTVTLALSETVQQNVYVTLAGTTGGTFDGTYPVTTTTTGATIPLTGLPSGTQAGAGGSFAAQGDRICDAIAGASFNPLPPYSSSCTGGVVWQDLGFQAARGDVFAVKLRP